jgi:hypothetical protein
MLSVLPVSAAAPLAISEAAAALYEELQLEPSRRYAWREIQIDGQIFSVRLAVLEYLDETTQVAPETVIAGDVPLDATTRLDAFAMIPANVVRLLAGKSIHTLAELHRAGAEGLRESVRDKDGKLYKLFAGLLQRARLEWDEFGCPVLGRAE